MKTLLIALVVGAVAVGGYVLVSGRDGGSALRTETGAEAQVEDNASRESGSLAVDLSLCTQHANGNYICEAGALAAFSRTVAHMEGGSCSVSYDSESGFSFNGRSKTAELAAGEMAVSLHPSGSVSGIARQDRQNLTLSVGEGGAIRSAMLLDTDYSQDLCLDL